MPACNALAFMGVKTSASSVPVLPFFPYVESSPAAVVTISISLPFHKSGPTLPHVSFIYAFIIGVILNQFRRNEPAPPVSCLVPPSIVLVADGAKIMWVGGEPYEYNAEKFLITSLDLPASSEVLQASTSRPCVGVAYKLDQRVLMELIAQGSLPPVKKRDAGTGIRGTFLMNLVFTQHKLNNDKNNNQYVMETPATFPLQ